MHLVVKLCSRDIGRLTAQI